MSISIVDNSNVRGVQNDIQQSGFRPQLFLVAGGSYISNAGYGSGAASTGTYDDQTPPVTVRNSGNGLCQTRAHIRQQDNDIDFEIAICLDANQAADPFANQASDEVRIRVLPLVTSPAEPARYLNPLKPTDRQYGLPLFLDIEAVDQLGNPLLPVGGTNRVLQARFLYGGQLALVQQDLSAGPPPTTSPLLASQLGPLLVMMGAGALVRLHVRGQYKGTLSV
jgi:hypothetical protein